MYEKTCARCGRVFDTLIRKQKICQECKQEETDKRAANPVGAKGEVRNVDYRESKIKSEWTKRVEAKMNRIVGEGYAERQKQQTLKLVEKIKVEL